MTNTMIDIEFDKQCEETSALAEMLSEDRREVEVRLRVCRHQHGFYVARGKRVCRDCGQILTKDMSYWITYGGSACSR